MWVGIKVRYLALIYLVHQVNNLPGSLFHRTLEEAERAIENGRF